MVNSNMVEVKDKLVINHPNNLIVKNDALKYTKWDIYQIFKEFMHLQLIMLHHMIKKLHITFLLSP